MQRRFYAFGVGLVFILALVDAHQDLASSPTSFFKGGMAVFAVGIGAVAPLALFGAAWRMSSMSGRLPALFGAVAFGFLALSLLAWGYHVYAGQAPPEGATQLHLLAFPVIGIIAAVALAFVCYLLALLYRHAPQRAREPNPSIERTIFGKPQIAAHVER